MESNLTKCKQCEVLKVKTEAGKYPKGKTKKFIDENGLQWNGKLCPQCNQQRAKNTMKASRIFKSTDKLE